MAREKRPPLICSSEYHASVLVKVDNAPWMVAAFGSLEYPKNCILRLPDEILVTIIDLAIEDGDALDKEYALTEIRSTLTSHHHARLNLIGHSIEREIIPFMACKKLHRIAGEILRKQTSRKLAIKVADIKRGRRYTLTIELHSQVSNSRRPDKVTKELELMIDASKFLSNPFHMAPYISNIVRTIGTALGTCSALEKVNVTFSDDTSRAARNLCEAQLNVVVPQVTMRVVRIVRV